jgi:putative membrane protein
MIAAAFLTLNASADPMTGAQPALKHADQSFIEKAAKDGMAEVEISRVAAERTSNPKVREFAQMMVSDHESANEALGTIAALHSINLPAKGSEAISWSKKDAKDFDHDYVEKMVSDHENAVKLFQKEANDGSDTETTAFARKLLPKLQHHLQEANDLKRLIK